MSEPLATPLSIPQMSPGAFLQSHRAEVADAIMRVVDGGWYILGSEVRHFEEEFADRFKLGSAVGVGNGTDALALALRSLGVGPGDRVATVSHTAVATVAAIEMTGAQPVMVEIDPETFTMSPASLARTMAAFDPVKAVVAVHLYGHPADMSAISQIARASGAFVIEDCAQAHGAMLDGRYAGSMSDIAAFSFYPTKNLGALGDGGMVVSNNPEVIKRVRMLREYGWKRRYVSEAPGVNSRLDELQAAILRVRLRHLDAGNLRRAEIAAAYDRELKHADLILPQTRRGALHVHHQYVVRHPKRGLLLERLRQRGIGANVHYPVPVHRQPAYISRCEIDPNGLEITERIANEVISLPMYPELSDEAVSAVIAAVSDSI